MNLEDLIPNNLKNTNLQIEEKLVVSEEVITEEPRFEINAQILGYPDEEVQLRAYNTALKYCISMEPNSIADVGCGKGDFFHYLNQMQLPVSYTGFEENGLIVKNSTIDLVNNPFIPEMSENYDWVFFINSFDQRYLSMGSMINFILETFKGVRKGISIVSFNENLLEVEPIFKPIELIQLLIDNNIEFLFEQDEYFYKFKITK
jgi:hypothetical protein